MPSSSCGVLDLNCHVGDAALSVFDRIAQAAAEAAATVIGDAMTWWLHTPSVDPDNAAVHSLQQYTLPIAAIVLTASVLNQALRMTLSRRKDPALNVGLGLLKYVVVTAVGLVLLSTVVKGGDEFADWLATQSVGQFAGRMKGLFATPAFATNPFLELTIGAVAVVIGALQWFLGLLRQGGILVLAGLMPIAASGSMNETTRPWLPRYISPLAALVVYKPIAALIFAAGFTFMGEGQDLTTVFAGLMVLVLAVIALPALMRFFAWSQVQASGGAGATGAIAAAATGAASIAALRAGSGMTTTGPGTGPTGAGGPPSGGPGGPAPGGGGPGNGPGGSGPGGGGPGGGPAGPSGAGSGAAGSPAAAGRGGATAASGGTAGAAAAAGPAGAAMAAAAAGAGAAHAAGRAATDAFTGGPP